MIEMPPLANRRVAEWGLLYAFLSLFALTTLALPASAKVLISVDKSTQQMSVSVDGVPRYSIDRSGGIRDAKRYLPSPAFGSLVVFEAVLQFANASFDLFPRRLRDPRQL